MTVIAASAVAASLVNSAPAVDASSITMRTITYHGYRFEVPASWPVYNLAADPARCVLLNRDAVYLGTPGARQQCPARAYGRADALLVQPMTASTALPPGAITLPASTATLGTRAQLPARVAELSSASHLLHVAAPGPGVLVTASYGSGLTQMRDILARARMTSRAPAADGQSATTFAGNAQAAAGAAHTATAGSSLIDKRGAGLGFDACTAPSVQQMIAWLSSPYRTIGTYLGGDNWACTYSNFTASWVQQVAAMGWRFIPIWVGPQAPCTSIGGAVTIDAPDASAEGEAEAASAVATAQSFGYGPSTPIYFDMEGYDNSDTSCSQAVLSFLDGWTTGLHAAGYLSGVYSSAGSGMVDLASQYGQSGYASPDDVWIADWNGSPELTDPYVPSADWADHQRLHQYYGGHNETWGGTTINIDNDAIGGDVAGAARSSSGATPALYSAPDGVTVAPGGTGTAALVLHGAGGTVVHWRAVSQTGLTVTPDQGVTRIGQTGIAAVIVHVRAGASTAAGRYDVPVTATAGSATLTETFELVTVSPAAAPFPIVLYAADPASLAVAVTAAAEYGLPSSDVTGSFVQAWNDVNSGSDLVLAVGEAAGNALNQNPCGWTDPAGTGAGSTPFYYIGEPLSGLAWSGVFEPSGGPNAAVTARVTTQLLHYALAGTLPNDGGTPVGPTPPADTCLGSASVPVP